MMTQKSHKQSQRSAGIMLEPHPDDLNNINHPIHKHKWTAFIEALAKYAADQEFKRQYGKVIDRDAPKPLPDEEEDTHESLEKRYGRKQVAEWIEKHNALMAFYVSNPDAPRLWAQDDPANPNRARRKKSQT